MEVALRYGQMSFAFETYGNLLVVLLSRRCVRSAEQCEKLLDVLDLGKHLSLHLSLTLKLIRGGIGKLLNVVEWKDTSLAPEGASPPIFVDTFENSNHVALLEFKLARLRGCKVEESTHSAHCRSCGAGWRWGSRTLCLVAGTSLHPWTGGSSLLALLFLETKRERHLQFFLLLLAIDIESRTVSYLKSVKLDVGIAMRETSDDTLDSLLGAILIVAYFIADLDNGTPIFGCEVLVGGLDYAGGPAAEARNMVGELGIVCRQAAGKIVWQEEEGQQKRQSCS
ncbi:hypothetical protein HG531_005360 [Fusarium graminearum]|nr:hypothetical protein HG531_005360 [Fusarium graminearum]